MNTTKKQIDRICDDIRRDAMIREEGISRLERRLSDIETQVSISASQARICYNSAEEADRRGGLHNRRLSGRLVAKAEMFLRRSERLREYAERIKGRLQAMRQESGK